MSTRLKAADVRDIRAKYATGKWSQKLLAYMYKVTPANIWYIVHRRTWRNVK